MKITAYRLYDQAVRLQPAAQAAQTEGKTPPALDGEPAPINAQQQGWVLLCPLAFEATWNGGARAEDIEIRCEGADAAQPAFVQSQLGSGRLTFYPGYQIKTDAEFALWVRGPINTPRDGLVALESIVDASLLPCTIAVEWQFTRPHQTIRFAAGEPFATLLLYPKTGLETASVEVRQLDDSEEAYEQAFQQMIDNPALQDVFLRLGVTPFEPTEPGTPPSPADCFDTIDGRIDLRQFEPDFFIRERFFGRPIENHLRHHGEIGGRDFYVIDALKLIYLSVPKVACTAIKLSLAKVVGIEFEPEQEIEYLVHFHPQWCKQPQSGYYRFSFVRNPFDRLVSCYRGKIIATPTANGQAPLYHNYYFTLPANISFADFAERVSKIPDALADSHFKSQYALLYQGKELRVDYVGKFEQLDRDWQPLAEKYQLPSLLTQANVSKNKPGCHSDYRLYYTEALVRMVYERYRKDVETFGYEEEYEQLLAFARQQQNVLPAVSE